MHIEFLHVLIEKGAHSRLALCVPFYEYAILSEVHNQEGDDGILENVHVDSSKGDNGVEIRALPFDPDELDEEYARMMKAYGKHDPKAVRKAYRDEDSLENAIARNMESCEQQIADGAEVYDGKPEMLVNAPIERTRRRRSKLKKGESLKAAPPKNKGGRPRKQPEQVSA